MNIAFFVSNRLYTEKVRHNYSDKSSINSILLTRGDGGSYWSYTLQIGQKQSHQGHPVASITRSFELHFKIRDHYISGSFVKTRTCIGNLMEHMLFIRWAWNRSPFQLWSLVTMSCQRETRSIEQSGEDKRRQRWWAPSANGYRAPNINRVTFYASHLRPHNRDLPRQRPVRDSNILPAVQFEKQVSITRIDTRILIWSGCPWGSHYIDSYASYKQGTF